MSRKRMIAPSIWEDPSFNKLGVTARLAFVGMISNADDDGYLRGDFGSLKRLIFGFDLSLEDNLWHEELTNYKNIHFYEVNGETYAHLLNWDKYQTQRDDRRQPSTYPKCTTCQADDGQLPAEVKLSKVSKVKLSKDNIPFDSFWNIYPKKTGKKKTEELWNKLNTEDQGKILEDIPRRMNDEKWKGGFIKDPERYIKYEQWNDEIIVNKGKTQDSLKTNTGKYDNIKKTTINQ